MHLEWACENCPKVPRDWEMSPYTKKMLDNYLLQEAGYPFQPNDLEPEEWLDLGRVKKCLTPAPFVLPLK